MALVQLGDKSVPEKRNENETNLTQKSDEAGRVLATPKTDKQQASSSAKGKVKTSAMKSIEAEAETIGLPYLKARETITIENIGKKFSGDWRITRVRHEISNSGYRCSLTLNKNDHSSSGGKKSGAAPKQSASTKNSTAKDANKTKGNFSNSGGGSSSKPKTRRIDLNNGEQVK